jgi:hypothetical protein
MHFAQAVRGAEIVSVHAFDSKHAEKISTTGRAPGDMICVLYLFLQKQKMVELKRQCKRDTGPARLAPTPAFSHPCWSLLRSWALLRARAKRLLHAVSVSNVSSGHDFEKIQKKTVTVLKGSKKKK